MISKLKIEGLKSIDVIDMSMKNLNLLLGTNSSGKSTMIQSILLASQSVNKGSAPLNGNLVSIGEFREARNFITNAKEIKVELETDCGNYSIRFKEDIDSQSGEACIKIDDTTEEVKKFLTIDEGIHYLSASRIGHRDTYDKNFSTIYKFGLQGEYALDYFEKHKEDILDDELIIDKSSNTLEKQVNYWLKYIVNTSIVTNDIKETDKLKAKFESSSGRGVRTKNIGSGLSYLISIIIMCLSMKKESTLIIENPEIHLHPKAQSKLTELFVFIANNERQLILETHSDHIFNGLRVAIVQNKIEKNNMNMSFFRLDDRGCSKNHLIDIGKRGRINNYIEDLFDQFDIDLDRMLGI
ncbi:DUF3696 domain-containing protein [Paraclostridium sordellii]|uniref:DUF3696 domain-containing protein n=1 Tax=Paraclostridium sordellii TaxID=1505 RepID=UPI001898095B|nr:DUF3696 domain-containing protein [Paeniclostridium sordellii]